MRTPALMLCPLVLLGAPLPAGPILDAARLGVRPDTGQDVTLALQALLDRAGRVPGTRVVLAPGTYLLRPEHARTRKDAQSNTTLRARRHYGLLLEGHRGTVLAGKGAGLRCHGEMSALGLVGCAQVRIEGITIAWDRPLTTEATVESVDPDGQVVRIDTARQPVRIEDGRLQGLVEAHAGNIWSAMEIDPATGRNLRDLYWGRDLKAQDLGGGRFRLFNGWKFTTPGRVIVLRHHERSHAGVFGEGGRDLEFRDVTMTGNAGLGLLFQQVRNITLLRTHVHAPKGSFAGPKDDAFHFSGVSGKVRIEACRVADTPDDPVNVHGTCLPVLRQTAPDTLRARFAHDQTPAQPLWGKPGDRLALVSRQTLLPVQRNVLRRYRLIDDREVELVFAKPLETGVGEGLAVENLSDYPEVTIRGCDFGNNRARGILVSTPRRVVIERNRFRVQGAAVLVPGDANGWFESGAVSDVLIRNNTFENCLIAETQFSEAVIAVYPEAPRREPGKYFHRNIRIEGNTFQVFDAPLLYADNVQGLAFRNNRLVRTDAFPAWLADRPAVRLIHCADVSIGGNAVEGNLRSTAIQLEDTDPRQVKVTGGDALQLR